MSKSVLYAANTATQATTLTGTIVNFGSVVRRYGCNLNVSGGNVVYEGSGYYTVDVNISYTGTAAGALTIQLYKDGVAIPGAEATVTTVAEDIGAITIPAIIRSTCCCEETITCVASGVAVNITNAAIVVEKE